MNITKMNKRGFIGAGMNLLFGILAVVIVLAIYGAIYVFFNDTVAEIVALGGFGGTLFALLLIILPVIVFVGVVKLLTKIGGGGK